MKVEVAVPEAGGDGLGTESVSSGSNRKQRKLERWKLFAKKIECCLRCVRLLLNNS